MKLQTWVKRRTLPAEQVDLLLQFSTAVLCQEQGEGKVAE